MKAIQVRLPGGVWVARCGATPTLVECARTDAEKEAQRRSFAFGNASIDNPNVTRAMVDEAAERTPRRDR